MGSQRVGHNFPTEQQQHRQHYLTINSGENKGVVSVNTSSRCWSFQGQNQKRLVFIKPCESSPTVRQKHFTMQTFWGDSWLCLLKLRTFKAEAVKCWTFRGGWLSSSVCDDFITTLPRILLRDGNEKFWVSFLKFSSPLLETKIWFPLKNDYFKMCHLSKPWAFYQIVNTNGHENWRQDGDPSTCCLFGNICKGGLEPVRWEII